MHDFDIENDGFHLRTRLLNDSCYMTDSILFI